MPSVRVLNRFHSVTLMLKGGRETVKDKAKEWEVSPANEWGISPALGASLCHRCRRRHRRRRRRRLAPHLSLSW